VLVVGPDPPRGRGNFEGCSVGPQQHGAADLSAGDSASRRKRGFRMNSPAAG